MKQWEREAVLVHTERLLGRLADVVMPITVLASVMTEISAIRALASERSFDDIETLRDIPGLAFGGEPDSDRF